MNQKYLLDQTTSPTQHNSYRLPTRHEWRTNYTNTNEITAWGSLYVGCHCLTGMRFCRTATVCNQSDVNWWFMTLSFDLLTSKTIYFQLLTSSISWLCFMKIGLELRPVDDLQTNKKATGDSLRGMTKIMQMTSLSPWPLNMVAIWYLYLEAFPSNRIFRP